MRLTASLYFVPPACCRAEIVGVEYVRMKDKSWQIDRQSFTKAKFLDLHIRTLCMPPIFLFSTSEIIREGYGRLIAICELEPGA